jgi:hypothetical protein
VDEQLNGAQAMALEAYVAHQIPGRVRLKVPAAKGRPDLLQRIVAAAGSASDIKSVQYNSLTGSLVICYAPAAYKSLDALGSILRDSTLRVSMHASRPAAGVRSRRARRGERTGPSAAAKAITSFFRSVDREIREVTDNELDLKVLLPLAAGVLGFLAFRRKAATPLWLTLMIFAFHSFLTLHGVAGTEEIDELTISAANGAPGE